MARRQEGRSTHQRQIQDTPIYGTAVSFVLLRVTTSRRRQPNGWERCCPGETLFSLNVRLGRVGKVPSGV
jgi:hypothetical protein